MRRVRVRGTSVPPNLSYLRLSYRSSGWASVMSSRPKPARVQVPGFGITETGLHTVLRRHLCTGYVNWTNQEISPPLYRRPVTFSSCLEWELLHNDTEQLLSLTTVAPPTFLERDRWF